MVQVAPSILSANFAHLAEDVQKVEQAGADWLHIDVMDGQFVPNISLGPQIVADLRKESKLFFDVHLMIETPERMIAPFIAAGADLITVHAESCKHLHRVVSMIKESGAQVGVALNPASPLALIEEILGELDLVLIMSVNPGYGGQKFIPASLGKVQRLKKMIDLSAKAVLIQVDGGVNGDNVSSLIAAGTDVVVAGSYIFGSSSISSAIKTLKSA